MGTTNPNFTDIDVSDKHCFVIFTGFIATMNKYKLKDFHKHVVRQKMVVVAIILLSWYYIKPIKHIGILNKNKQNRYLILQMTK